MVTWSESHFNSSSDSQSLADYISRIEHEMTGEFWLQRVHGEAPNLKCAVCKRPIGKVTTVWVGGSWIVHQACGGNQPSFSNGSSYRCIECSLVRCGRENSRCEECTINMRTGT